MVAFTIENCIQQVLSRFELVVLASYRAEEIGRGSPIKIEKLDNKNCELALREIAEKSQDINKLRQLYVKSLQCNTKVDEILSDESLMLDEGSDDLSIDGAEELIESEFISVEEDSMDFESDSKNIDDKRDDSE